MIWKECATLFNWMVKTSIIGGIIWLVPMPSSMSSPMRLGTLTIIMASLILQDGSINVGNGIKTAGKEVGGGLSSVGLGIGLGFGLGLASLAVSNVLVAFTSQPSK